MFERYTEAARRALFFARYESSQLGAVSIETEHMLLGLLQVDPRQLVDVGKRFIERRPERRHENTGLPHRRSRRSSFSVASRSTSYAPDLAARSYILSSRPTRSYSAWTWLSQVRT